MSPAPPGESWRPPPSQEARRIKPLRLLASPWTEREFLHRRYESLLARLEDSSRFRVVPLRDFASAPRDRIVVSLRHDVDERLDNALDLARLEHDHHLPATYFILHTTHYYGTTEPGRAEHDESVIDRLRALQNLGHEVGWHNDLVTLQCVYGVDPAPYLARELEWLRGHGIDVRGSASHGSYWCHALGFHNNYFFTDFSEVLPGFPNNEIVSVDGRPCKIGKGRLADFGLEYEAYHLGEHRYFSDARFDEDGRRWHPDLLDLDELEPGDRVMVLTHPEYWHASPATKAAQTFERGARRVLTRRRL